MVQNFFSTITERSVAGSHAFPDCGGDIPENPVSVLVSVLVVMRLEMVDVTHHESVIACAFHCALVKTRNPLFEVQPVADFHKRVEP